MNPLFTCPPPTALATIAAQACPERFDQIIKIFIQRTQVTPSFTHANILLSATWTPLLVAADSTKVVKTPAIPNIVIPPGGIAKEGGDDNTTINGIPRLLGLQHVSVTAMLIDADKTTRAALRGLATESSISAGYTGLWAYFVNRYGQVIASISGANDAGFPIYNFVVGDVGTQGFNKVNEANLSFDLAPGWSDNAVMYTPSFDILAL